MVEEGRGPLRASYAECEQAIEMLKVAFRQERLLAQLRGSDADQA